MPTPHVPPGAPDDDAPHIDRLVGLLQGPFERRTTLLAVCPNSRTVVRAALEAAQEAEAPMLFAATLNQVDRDGGYTGWTPRDLVGVLDRESARVGLRTPVLPCLDHGGPWLKDRHAAADLPYDDAMEEVKHSLEACIDAGYALLHIDPTVDRTVPRGRPLAADTVVARTLELIEHAEAYRRAGGHARLSYEVGTEEVHGGVADLAHVDAFLEALARGLRERGLDRVRPVFVVGKVGTDLHTTSFDADMARELTARVRRYGALVKGHYTDEVDHPEEYPLSGMGGANVGPALAAVEYDALRDLERLAEKVRAFDAGAATVAAGTALSAALEAALVASGRWEKWRQPDEADRPFTALSPERRRWLLRTGSRYVWTDAGVEAARAALYEAVADHADGARYVTWRVKTRILAYLHAFNLVGFAARAERALGG